MTRRRVCRTTIRTSRTSRRTLTGIRAAVGENPLDPANELPDSIRAGHENLGDLVLSAAPGFKFSEGTPGNPIPGNHGHVPTLRSTMIVSGGSPWVKKGIVVEPSLDPATITNFDRLPEQSENVDVAPTVAWLLGLGIEAEGFPDGSGFDGRILSEAFAQFDDESDPAPPTVCGRFDP